jgi:hypothetical protein
VFEIEVETAWEMADGLLQFILRAWRLARPPGL